MKILMVDPDAIEPAPRLKVFADSALSQGNHPLFLPDGVQWEGLVCPAIRVDRLGMNIAEKFAHRYYGHATAVYHLTPAGNQASEIYRAMDRAVNIGTWLPLDGRRSLRISCPAGEACADIDGLNTDKVIAALSRTMTLKMGDIIFFSRPAIRWQPAIGTTVTANVDGTEVIRFNIK